MANEIKDLFGSSTGLTITLSALASSTTGVGRQSTIIDNTTARYTKLLIYAKITLGTSPTGNRPVYFYLVRGDAHATIHRSDAAGASDAAHTIYNAPLIGAIFSKPSPATNDILQGEFVVNDPGPQWGITVVHNTAVNLKTEAGTDHWVRYIGINPEVQ